MKDILKSAVITVIITLLFSFNIRANINFEEETYIDDIPFNTEAIYSKVIIERHILDFELNEESYINDIPFSTEAVAEDKLYKLALMEEFILEDEKYIDDIPFNTTGVCQHLNEESGSDSLTCVLHKTNIPYAQEEEVEIKYYEQHSQTLVRF